MEQLTDLLRTNACPDCGVSPGGLHAPGCETETCVCCGRRLRQCVLKSSHEDNEDRKPWAAHPKRIPWDGQDPLLRTCHEFGWFARLVHGRGWETCGPDDSGAIEDLSRLYLEAEWDRERRWFFRTNFTEAVGSMRRRGILVSPGWEASRDKAASQLTRDAKLPLLLGRPAKGYAFYTYDGGVSKETGLDFSLHFGGFEYPRLGDVGLAAKQVGTVVCECLDGQKVGYCWDGVPGRPIRIVTRSIVSLDSTSPCRPTTGVETDVLPVAKPGFVSRVF